MPINPLDLQTNFMQIGNVVKKEVLSREQEILRQSHLAEHIRKEEDKTLEDVPETHKTDAHEKLDIREDTKKDKKNKEKTASVKDSESEDGEEHTEEQLHENGVGTKLDLMG